MTPTERPDPDACPRCGHSIHTWHSRHGCDFCGDCPPAGSVGVSDKEAGNE